VGDKRGINHDHLRLCESQHRPGTVHQGLAQLYGGRAGAGRSLADAWADTTTPHGRLMLTVLGGLAEFERELIRARTGEGRKRAQARGVKFGRPPKLNAHQRKEASARMHGTRAVKFARFLDSYRSSICTEPSRRF
jgi:Resolvase, N terminal domain